MVFPFHHITKSPSETQKLGEAIGASFITEEGRSLPHVICLWGDLGSGKTTWTQGFAKGLGIVARVLSPTFIIVRHYPVPAHDMMLYHWDLYRTHSAFDAQGLGMSEVIRDAHAVSVIEWPERLGDLVPQPRIDFRFSVRPNGVHEIEGRMV